MLISGQVDSKYIYTRPDIMVYTPSGSTALNDGVAGGPIGGVGEGFFAYSMIQPFYYSGLEGYSLQALQNEFPVYTRISWDKSSLGAQLLNSIAPLIDEVIEEKDYYRASLFLGTYPIYRTGVTYEWDFNQILGIRDLPKVEAQISGQTIHVPTITDQKLFWDYPPTRCEPTTAEISGTQLLGWTKINSSGLIILPISGYLPLYSNVYIEISGASQFVTERSQTDTDLVIEDTSVFTVKGHSIFGDEAGEPEIENGIFAANGVTSTDKIWKYIDEFSVFGMDPEAYIRVRIFNFNRRFIVDGKRQNWTFDRNQSAASDIWQLCHGTTQYKDLVQTEATINKYPTSGIWLARCASLRDTFDDASFEYNILDTWKILTPNNNALSGIIDFAYIPGSNYLALLDNQSKIWVVDTYKPGINMNGFSETRQPPARIHLEYPKTSYETPERFTVKLTPVFIDTSDGVTRYKWIVYHHNKQFDLTISGAEAPYAADTNWYYMDDKKINLEGVDYVISGTGQYTFELQLYKSIGELTRTFSAVNNIEKKSLGYIPLLGLSAHPSGLAFDAWGRLWVTDGSTSARFVMRYDVGAWLPNERVLLTREKYDSVSSNSLTQTSGIARNSFMKIDDLGFMLDQDREPGETIANFKYRLLGTAYKQRSATSEGISNALSTEFGLNSLLMAKISTNTDYRLRVDQVNIYISGENNYYTIPLIEKDLDGDWYFPTIHKVVSGINQCSGITAVVSAPASGLYGFLINPYDSYKQIVDETVAAGKYPQLGVSSFINFKTNKLLKDKIEFLDIRTFRTFTSGIPTRLGEWAVDDFGNLKTFSTPSSPITVTYTYNTFISGQTIELHGNAAKVINPAAKEIEPLFFDINGPTAYNKDIAYKIMSEDRLYWGK